MHICWGAQASLYYHCGIPKHVMNKKMFGVFGYVFVNDTIATEAEMVAQIVKNK